MPLSPRLLVAVGLLLCSAIAFWLFVGVFDDPEHAEHHLFLKHRPSFLFHFRSPIGESDKTLSSLSPEDQTEQRRYQEFVEHGGGFRRSVFLPF